MVARQVDDVRRRTITETHPDDFWRSTKQEFRWWALELLACKIRKLREYFFLRMSDARLFENFIHGNPKDLEHTAYPRLSDSIVM